MPTPGNMLCLLQDMLFLSSPTWKTPAHPSRPNLNIPPTTKPSQPPPSSLPLSADQASCASVCSLSILDKSLSLDYWACALKLFAGCICFDTSCELPGSDALVVVRARKQPMNVGGWLNGSMERVMKNGENRCHFLRDAAAGSWRDIRKELKDTKDQDNPFP